MNLVDPVELSLDFAMLTSFEVPTSLAQRALPEELDAVEVKPGIALAALIVFRVADGSEHAHLGRLPGYGELILAFQVAPSLRRSLPRLAFFVQEMCTSLESASRFMREEHGVDARSEALALDVDAGGAAVSVSDGRGPILEMANRTAEPAWVPRETLGQVFVRRDGRVAMYHEVLTGIVHEHQSRGAAHVRLFPHPFLSALDGVRETPRSYLQMLAKPGTRVVQRAERPRWLD